MENNVVHNLREWAPLTVLEKIPVTIFNGLFRNDINITCIDVIPEFIALGSDAGIVYWYNRYNGECQKLRIEVSSVITTIKVVSSVEYMIAAGTRNGQVNVFQIQKEIPEEIKLTAPFTRSKPIQRFTIRELHKSPITCCEWSKNGMKLYSADKDGLIVLTTFDYQKNLSKSLEIFSESYSIVQLSLNQPYLLISTLYRTIICEPDCAQASSRWKAIQIGKNDRKILGEFGATFQTTNERSPPKIIASRPGFRFWLANCNGVVEKTFIFKDAPIMRPTWEIPLLNPKKNSTSNHLKNFTCVYPYLKKFYITNDDVSLYILNLEDLKIEAIARNFRSIINYAVCGNEIFVLEGGRSLIRLSNKPEPPTLNATIIFNPILPPPIPQMGIFEAPIEFTEDENVIGAEEVFEMPPLEPISADIPIQTHIDSPDTETKKLIEENRRKLEILQKIGKQEFEEEILYKSEKKEKSTNKIYKKKEQKMNKTDAIVEIGQNVESKMVENSKESKLKPNIQLEITTKSQEMKSSFCKESTSNPDKEIVNTEEVQQRIEILPEITELVKKSPSSLEVHNNQQLNLSSWPSLNYPLQPSNIEYINSPEPKIEQCYIKEEINTSNDKPSNEMIEQISLILKNESTSTENHSSEPKIIPQKNETDLSPELGGRGTQLKREDIPKHLIIPSIFNLKGENGVNNSNTEELDSNQSHTSEWEFVNDKNSTINDLNDTNSKN